MPKEVSKSIKVKKANEKITSEKRSLKSIKTVFVSSFGVCLSKVINLYHSQEQESTRDTNVARVIGTNVAKGNYWPSLYYLFPFPFSASYLCCQISSVQVKKVRYKFLCIFYLFSILFIFCVRYNGFYWLCVMDTKIR